MDPKSTNRIIGDAFEINADIVKNNIESKYPRFIANIISNIYRKKLIKIIEKFKKSNYILTKDNITEYFIYVYNNYNGNYGCINHVKLETNYDKSIIDCALSFDNCKILINMATNEPKMNISGIIDNGFNNPSYKFSISENKLYTNKPNAKDIFPSLNNILRTELSDYILLYLKSYIKRKGDKS